MSYRSMAIANEFLRRAPSGTLTQMQLQKLVFISNGWNLAINQRPLTSDQPQAWTYGPVYPDLYDHTKFFGSRPIGRLITPDDDEIVRFFGRKPSGRPEYKADLDASEKAIVDNVWTRYGALSGVRLSALTHQPGTPWSEASKRGKNAPIDQSLIRRHYESLADQAARAANA